MTTQRPANHDNRPDNAMTRLVERFSRLPGIGKRSAERLAFYLLKSSADEAEGLAQAIVDLKKKVHHCVVCFNLCEGDRCDICNETKRNHTRVLVVEQPSDVVTFEATGLYDGVYHVLMGRLSALDGIGPGELNVDALLNRCRDGAVTEVILGTNPTLEGDGTAMYLAEALAAAGVKVSRLARGLPTGAHLEQVSKAVLADAIAGRQSM